MVTLANRHLDLPAQAGLVWGQSEAIQGVNAIVGQIASTEIGVLLIGESGTGKETYARLIHRLSVHQRLPLKKLSCAALEPEQLLPQLKTYLQDPIGGGEEGLGTLFLDGIDELELTSQKVLLSLLPEGEAGEISEKRFRLISAARQDLDAEIGPGRFRSELYFRINGVCLHLPALRDRKEDIPAFMEYFLAKHASELKRQAPMLGVEELELLAAYDWPGNIRELGNLARKMVALGNPESAIADLGTTARTVMKAPKISPTFSLKVAARAASRKAERQLILKALERTHWNRKRAAQELQISYKSLLYKIKQTGVTGAKASER
jgi:two-component system response regulator AtoC